MMIRVLVVDDSLFMRTVISDMLISDPEIEVVGTATDGVSATKVIDEKKPDVMTLDIEMPHMNGLELLSRRKSFRHFPRTIMISSLTAKGADATNRAISLGADDFLLKPKGIENMRSLRDELLLKIKNVMRIPCTRTQDTTKGGMAKDVVIIGSSAGGPPMLDVLMSSFPSKLKAAVVITQHMPEGGFTKALATRLNRVSVMPVKESESGDILISGQVYVTRGGNHAVITTTLTEEGEKGGKIIHSRSPPVHGVRPAADITFTSASKVFNSHVISVILSGMGDDCGAGCLDVKQKGGFTIVAHEKDCLVYGMAKSALSRKCVDKILPLNEIAGEVTRLLDGQVRGRRNV